MKSENEVEIDLNDLRKAVNRVLDHIEKKGKQKLALTQDYYWDIDQDARYSLDEPGVSDLLAGQLCEDCETVVNLARSNKGVISWHLVPISAVLRWIGESEVS